MRSEEGACREEGACTKPTFCGLCGGRAMSLSAEFVVINGISSRWGVEARRGLLVWY